MKLSHLVVSGLCALSLGAHSVSAQPGGAGPFAAGFAGDVEQLPPGRLKSQIEKLPAAAQQQALEWLARFEIPTEDYEYLRADPEGGIYYADTEVPAEAPVASEASTVVASAPEQVFKLHSRPGASKVVFLDFDGHVISGKAWNNAYGVSSFNALPYDTDGLPGSFSESERAAIAAIWHRVAEDLAPFDIDVTTEDPGAFGPTVGHVLITEDTDGTGQAMPSQGAGGVAYVGVWGASYYTTYQPALVYFNRLGNGYPHYVAEAASHEFGHNMGLGHDGVNGGASYYSGQGAGYVKWGPIMGVGYYSHVTQWSKGEYPNANNLQDDIAILSSQLNYRPDDHAGDLTGATPLQVDANGVLYVTTPEFDATNAEPNNKGVIETSVDTDMFWFDTAAGGVTLNVIPAWEAFYDDYRRGANLDIEATVYDEFGNWVATAEPEDETIAQFNLSLAAGRYYLEVRGVGNAVTPYSDYGSLGMYYISGTVQPVVTVTDLDPPTPNPLGWAALPAATSRTSISMTSQTATDDSGVVEYMFLCTAGDTGCTFSGWQSGSSYVATGLKPGASYTFSVQARDQYGNETTWSTMASATTDPNQIPVADADNAVLDQDTAITITVLTNDTDADGDALSIATYTQGANGSVTLSGSALTYTPNAGFFGIDSFTYTVSDGFDQSVAATVTITVNEVTAANQAPVAVDDSATVAMSSAVLIDVLANDSDPEGDTLSILSVTQGGKGSVSIVGDQLEYTSGSKRGGDTFTYTISDGNGGTATGIVNISITRDGATDGGGTGGGKCNPRKTSC
ncbi:Ig-like domain-containing protein [Neptuniibacter sp. CAU 1671]|uniref:Ig-like domain-containing protein n=1 Tax=Neptuniibacter sp. CAU 1671 TaxID=3032593 RepID=UPI0023DA3670|nr:Ig-like domain-containing protein [Neptuniibacter sp. CAU 1671]MDF2181871.1 Ig-like domain-containing protein [Neptuniibacter sp. CAU 1671]